MMQRNDCLPGVIVYILNYGGQEDGRKGMIIPNEEAALALAGRELALMRDSGWVPVRIQGENVIITFPANRLHPIPFAP